MHKIQNSDGKVIVRHLEIARTFWQRFRGLMLRNFPDEESGLLIEKCKSIHCCFMLMSIDVLFLSKDGTIVHSIKNMRPWSLSPYIKNAYSVLECKVGTIEVHGLQNGQKLIIV